MLIIHNTNIEYHPICDVANNYEEQVLQNFTEYFNVVNENDITWKKSEIEFRINNICEYIIRSHRATTGFIIADELDNSENSVGVLLALHLRLTPEFKSIPIIIITKHCSYRFISHNNYQYYFQILYTKGTFLLSSQDTEIASFDFCSKLNDLTLTPRGTTREVYKLDVINKLSFLPQDQQLGDTRHSIANEWGAYKLARVANLSNKDNFSHPQTAYFKYLKMKAELQQNSETALVAPQKLNFIENDIRLLLLDDQANEWENCIRFFFNERICANGKSTIITSCSSITDNDVNSYKNDITEHNYDLILLDLYWDNITTGEKLLEIIKEWNPAIPVIIFTASNKAWNLEKLYDLGADGYYIKEHPDFDMKMSHDQYVNLTNTIDISIKKGEKLKFFWQETQKIKSNVSNIILHQKLKDRIIQKLHLAFGLLRRELTSFEENSPLDIKYTAYDIAFLTYWSCLNEFITDRLGDMEHHLEQYRTNRKNNTTNTLSFNPPSNATAYFDGTKWKIKWKKNVSTGFAKYTTRFGNGNYPNGYYEKLETSTEPRDIRQPLFCISAYILLVHNTSQPDDLIDRFITLNAIRNRLDFTHANYGNMTTQDLAPDGTHSKEDCKAMIEFLCLLMQN